MAAFTMIAQCGHRQMVVAQDATEATRIFVVACAMCNSDYPSFEDGDQKYFARPQLKDVEYYTREPLEMLWELGPLPLQICSESAPTETYRIEVPKGMNQWGKVKFTYLHGLLLFLRLAHIKVEEIKNLGERTDVIVSGSRFDVLNCVWRAGGSIRVFKHKSKEGGDENEKL